MLAVGALASFTMVSQGYPNRITEEFRNATAELVLPRKSNGWCFHNVADGSRNEVGEEGLRCHLGAQDGRLDALLFGDSFAGHYGPFWDELGRENGLRINAVASNWCYPSVDEDFTGHTSGPEYQQCLINRDFLEAEIGHYDLVIYAGQWGAVHRKQQMDGVERAIELASQRSGLVVLMAAPTNYDVSVKDMYERSLMFGRPFDITRFNKSRDVQVRAANEYLKAIAGRYSNVMFFDRESMFQVNGVPSDVTAENVPFGLDQSGHISIYGSRKAAEAFRETALYQEFIERASHPELLARTRTD